MKEVVDQFHLSLTKLGECFIQLIDLDSNNIAKCTDDMKFSSKPT